MNINHRIMVMGIFLVIIASAGFAQVSGSYFGQEPPGMTAEIFAPGFISLDNRYEYGFALSPDGRQCLFMETNYGWDYFQILYTEMGDDGYWSDPVVPSFCQGYQNLYPSFSQDGQTLFFSSPRPSVAPFDVDLYTTQWTGSDWTEPVKIPAPISSVGSREYRATVTQDGTLYYTSNGIYRAPFVNGEYGTPEYLPRPINGNELNGSPFIAPDESYLIFESGRPGGYGQNDLYISYRQDDDTWSHPINLGPAVNTEGIEDSGFVTHDGKYFIFCRRAAYATSIQTDIYWIDVRTVLPDPNGPIENLFSGLRFSSLQCAINYADQGDALVLQPGTYEGSLLLDKNITIESTDPNDPLAIGSTVIQGDLQEPVITLQNHTDYVEIVGLTLRAGSTGIQGTATNATIHNCRIMDNAAHGVELSQSSSPLFQHCLITANGQTGITMIADTSGRTVALCKPTIEDCVIVQNGEAALDGGEPIIMDSIVE